MNNIRNYLKHEVVTKVREINEFPSYFPAITICNLIYFQTEYSKEFMIGIADFYGLPNIFNSSEYNASDFATLLQKYDQLGSAVVVEQNLNKTEIQKFGYSIDEMLISCQFNQFTCNSSEFAWFFHPEYGYLRVCRKEIANYISNFIYILKVTATNSMWEKTRMGI